MAWPCGTSAPHPLLRPVWGPCVLTRPRPRARVSDSVESHSPHGLPDALVIAHLKWAQLQPLCLRWHQVDHRNEDTLHWHGDQKCPSHTVLMGLLLPNDRPGVLSGGTALRLPSPRKIGFDRDRHCDVVFTSTHLRLRLPVPQPFQAQVPRL